MKTIKKYYPIIILILLGIIIATGAVFAIPYFKKNSLAKNNEEIACLFWFKEESDEKIIDSIKNEEQLRQVEEILMKWDEENEKNGNSESANQICASYK